MEQGLMGVMRALLLVLISTLGTVSATSRRPKLVNRESSQLRPSYDFVVVGGGTSGLTVADRLAAAFPKRSVLVIEYGTIENAPGVFDPPTIWIGPAPDAATAWTFLSLPNPEVNNKTAFVQAGQVVGGSSAVNGMFFDRPSRFDLDLWAEIGGPGYATWTWEGVFPFFRKSVTFTEPPPPVAQKYGYAWDISAYGGTTPIYSSFGDFQWAGQPVLNRTWQDLGVKVNRECAGGDKEGICWLPSPQHPVTARRSHAGLGHYAQVVSSRPNYELLVKHQVVRVVYPEGLKSGPPVVEVRSLADDRLFNVTAKAEVILSAGALHTPTILQRSGIGPASFSNSAGIPVVLDLPGVGSNFQDHSGPPVMWNSMLDQDYQANATAGFNQTPATGPYTLASGNSAIFVPLPKLSREYKSIAAKIRKIATDGSAASYLAPGPDYRTNPAMVKGYTSQLLALANFLENPKAPSLETPWATGTVAWAFLLHPLSHGTVRLNLSAPLDQPILDYRAGTNPIDFDLHVAHLRFLRSLINTPTMQKYGAVEISPGSTVPDTDEVLIPYIKDQIVLSFMHPCCTAAAMPKSKGGVVGPDLKVHGAKGLRVVDMSVLPVLPSAHLSATAYAVGEKAAQIIIDEWSRA